MTDVNTVRRAAKRVKTEKKPKSPDPVVTAVERLTGAQEKMATALAKKDEGVLELLSEALRERSPEVTVELDAEAIGRAVGDAVGREMEKHKAEPRERGSYYMTIDRNGNGEMSGARIDPVTD